MLQFVVSYKVTDDANELQRRSFQGLLEKVDEDSTKIRNVSNYVPVNMAQHPSWSESSATRP